jgi:hypothetical protein
VLLVNRKLKEQLIFISLLGISVNARAKNAESSTLTPVLLGYSTAFAH